MLDGPLPPPEHEISNAVATSAVMMRMMVKGILLYVAAGETAVGKAMLAGATFALSERIRLLAIRWSR